MSGQNERDMQSTYDVTSRRLRVTIVCNCNATMPSLCIANLHVSVNSTNVLSAAQELFYSKVFRRPQ